MRLFMASVVVIFGVYFTGPDILGVTASTSYNVTLTKKFNACFFSDSC